LSSLRGRDLFELDDLGTRDLKGIPGPVRLWAAVRASSVASRFEALRAAVLTPLVGREEEIELLLRRWRRATSSEGQVVLICGEPGIGKSRLAAALRERLEGEELTRLRILHRPIIRTVRSIPSSLSSNAPPFSSATICP
jgi:hypothetical protein